MQLNLLTSVTANTTSDPNKGNIENFAMISIMFVCSGHASGNGAFTVDISNDGVTWATSVAIIDAASTTPSTRVTTATLSANGAKMYYLGNDFGAKLIRVNVVVTTDGSYSAILQGQVPRSH